MNEFVEGWMIIQTLGEGSYGEVKLLHNRNTGSAVAMKVVDLVKHLNAKGSVRKEAIIHNRLSHSNIISYYGQRQDENYVYMFLEYASGGELFDRIEPDVGMPEVEAQKYFTQLISGVEYLHSLGITHRDLKPENLLLDHAGNLKISDFGMATFFRVEGKTRLLESKCGTLPYVAPEVLVKTYQAEPADLWSCGIILVALLSGELPWDKPTAGCAEYIMWSKSKYTQFTPWSKINTLALSLIRKILVPAAQSRYTLTQIQSHRWYSEDITQSAMSVGSDAVNSNWNALELLSYSQPEEMAFSRDTNRNCHVGLFSFSQPTQTDDLLVSTQLLSSQSVSTNMNCLQKLVKRMTRFFVKTNSDESITRLTAVIEKLGYSWKHHSEGIVNISTIDRRKTMLTFRASVLTMEGYTLLDFRLSRGCGIEFKKCFIAVKREFLELIIKGPAAVG